MVEVKLFFDVIYTQNKFEFSANVTDVISK